MQITDYGPYVRIILRYLIGGVVIGNQAVGDQLATDPDLIVVCGAMLAAMVELIYILAKRNGGAT